jgi:ABC-type transporter MlaC component
VLIIILLVEPKKNIIKNIKSKDNKEYKLAEKQKKIYKNNKEKIRERQNKYYELNKEKLLEKFDCDCGGKYTTTNKKRHLKSKKHQNFISQK